MDELPVGESTDGEPVSNRPLEELDRELDEEPVGEPSERVEVFGLRSRERLPAGEYGAGKRTLG